MHKRRYFSNSGGFGAGILIVRLGPYDSRGGRISRHPLISDWPASDPVCVRDAEKYCAETYPWVELTEEEAAELLANKVSKGEVDEALERDPLAIALEDRFESAMAGGAQQLPSSGRGHQDL